MDYRRGALQRKQLGCSRVAVPMSAAAVVRRAGGYNFSRARCQRDAALRTGRCRFQKPYSAPCMAPKKASTARRGTPLPPSATVARIPYAPPRDTNGYEIKFTLHATSIRGDTLFPPCWLHSAVFSPPSPRELLVPRFPGPAVAKRKVP